MNSQLRDGIVRLGSYPEWKSFELYLKEEIEERTQIALTPGTDILVTEIARVERTILQGILELPLDAAQEREEQDEPGT